MHEVGGEVDNGFVHPSTHRDLRLVQHPRDVEHPLSGFTVLDERIGLGEGACRYGITHGNAQSPDAGYMASWASNRLLGRPVMPH